MLNVSLGKSQWMETALFLWGPFLGQARTFEPPTGQEKWGLSGTLVSCQLTNEGLQRVRQLSAAPIKAGFRVVSL